MPPRISTPTIFHRSSGPRWMCASWVNDRPTGAHARWTALLLMAELSVGHARFSEPRWTLLPFGRRWVLMWNCRACGRSTMTPAAHGQAHDDASRLRIARIMADGPLTDA